MSIRSPVAVHRLLSCLKLPQMRFYSADKMSLHYSPFSQEFYDTEANTNRHYYYLIDSRGQTHLHSTKYRSIATAYRDPVFLRILYQNMQCNSTQNHSDLFPYLSKCGHETNFVAHEDKNACLGFIELQNDLLLYAGGKLSVQFDPSKLKYNEDTGRLYHPVTKHKYLVGQLGLLHPSITTNLFASNITSNDESNYVLKWNNKTFLVNKI